jgi:hypothetical protein
MTLRPLNDEDDDDKVLARLAEALRHAGTVPESVRAAASAAFAMRTVDPRFRLASISYESCPHDRSVSSEQRPTDRRIIAFRADTLSVLIETTSTHLAGRLIPPTSGDIVMMTVAGPAGETTTDAAGCFILRRPAPGPVRLHCETAHSAVITDWVRL